MALIHSLRIRIQRALVSAVQGFELPRVTYALNGAPNEIDDAGENIYTTPKTPIICNEVRSSFVRDDLYGREDLDRRESWTFVLRMQFDHEVLLEPLEKELTENPIVVPRISDLPQATIRLRTVEVEHPVQKNRTNGTFAEMVFDIELSRQ